MPRNFLIVYSAREGSSAIVARLSGNPRIAVPVFEELDAFWIRSFYDKLDLPDTLDRVYATGRFDMPHAYGRNKFLARGRDRTKQPDAPVPREDLAVGFKWRPHGVTRSVVEVLRRHDVLVFHLVRRDFLELVSSLYISEQHIDGKKVGHAQFKAARSESQRAEVREALDGLEVEARFLPLATIALRRVTRVALQRRLLRRLRRAGIETAVLHYEDFNADSAGFIARLQTTLGVPSEADAALQPRARLEKVANKPARDRLRGLDRLPHRLVLGLLGRLYGRLIRPLPQRSELTGTHSVL